MTRDPDSLVLEADYARALLDELRELHDLVGSGARTLAEALVSSVPLATLCTTTATQADYEKVVTALSSSMDAYKKIQDGLNAIGRLWDGRLAVLAADADELTGGTA